MDNEILFKILQLDSLDKFLNWQDRIKIHLYMLGRAKMTSSKIIDAYEWIEKNDWEAPLMKYGQDYLQVFYDPDSEMWLPVESYIELNPDLLTLTRF